METGGSCCNKKLAYLANSTITSDDALYGINISCCSEWGGAVQHTFKD